MKKPVFEESRCGGLRKVYRFSNGYGASVIKHQFSYGGDEGLWELAVLRFTGADNSDCVIDYSTPITGDVIGYLTPDEVEEILSQIEVLSKKG
jgi:hypothetical protein